MFWKSYELIDKKSQNYDSIKYKTKHFRKRGSNHPHPNFLHKQTNNNEIMMKRPKAGGVS